MSAVCLFSDMLYQYYIRHSLAEVRRYNVRLVEAVGASDGTVTYVLTVPGAAYR